MKDPDPTKQQPGGSSSPAAGGAEPRPEPDVKPTDKPGAEPTLSTPLEVKVEGEGVPEKYRGKTLKDVLASVHDLESKLTTAETEVSQWRAHYVRQQQQGGQQAPGQQGGQQFDPLKFFDEDQAKAIMTMINYAQVPLLEGVGAIHKEFVRNTRPDFSDYEKRTDEIYAEMHPSYKFHPKYGYDYAYRLAKAEVMEPGQQKPPPPEPGPSSGAPEPRPKGPPPLDETEKFWATKMGVTEEEFRKYSAPVDITKPLEEKK